MYLLSKFLLIAEYFMRYLYKEPYTRYTIYLMYDISYSEEEVYFRKGGQGVIYVVYSFR